jgi:hypothetical protein
MPPPEVLTNDQLFGSWDLKKGGYTPEIVKKLTRGSGRGQYRHILTSNVIYDFTSH